MAENKLISELSGITNPSLTGYTVYDDGITTYKMALGELTAYVAAAEGDFTTTGSNTFKGNQIISGSLTITGSVTANSFVGNGSGLTNLPLSHLTTTSSFNTHTSSVTNRLNSIELKTGSFATTGSNTFLGSQTIKDAVIIGPSGSRHTNNPEMLHVQNSGSFNIAHLQGNVDSYFQLNIKNESSAAGASTDFVATADNGTENLHYVNMGINSSGFLTPFSVGYQNDAYLINRGRDLYIGSLDGPDYNHTHVHLFSSNSWQNPQISIISEGKIGFNTGSVTTGYTYEFSGSAKFVNNIQATTIVGSGDLNLLTDGENVNILGSNLVIPNGGINTSFNLTSVGASITQVTNIDSVTEKLIPYNAPSTGITHNFLSGSIAYVSNPSSDFIIDVVETPITNNKAIGLTVIVEQGTPAYKITGLKINSNDEGSVSINWFGGSQPTGTTNSTDIFAFSLIKVNNTWRVLGQKTTF